jgi:hypothetical protein
MQQVMGKNFQNGFRHYYIYPSTHNDERSVFLLFGFPEQDLDPALRGIHSTGGIVPVERGTNFHDFNPNHSGSHGIKAKQNH